MLKPARMRKFRVIFPKWSRDNVIAILHEAGVVQLKEISELELARQAVREELLQLSSLISKFKDMAEFLGEPVGRPKVCEELTYERTLKMANESLRRLEPKVGLLKGKVEHLDREKQELLTKIELLDEFREIKFSLKYLRSTEEIQVTVGRIDEEKLTEFFSEAREALGQRLFISFIGAGKKRTVIAACRARDYPKLSPVIYRHDVEVLSLPPALATPSASIRELKKQVMRVEKQRLELGDAVGKLARAKAMEVFQVMELLEIQRERLESCGLLGQTDATVVMEGWVRAKDVARVEKTLIGATEGHQVFRAYEPSKDEVEAVPIELENPKVLEDFEFVTGMYGLARYDEIDPTPFIGFTFSLFFAIALSDAGYGIALGLFMGSGLWLAKVFPPKLRRMMMVCAIFTVGVGILVGGWFGFGSGLWINSVLRPVPVLKLVIFVGIVHLLMAYGLAGVLKDIFRRDWSSLILNRVSPVLTMSGFFGLSFCVLGIGLYEFGINYAFPKIELFSAFNPLELDGTVVAVFKVMFYLGLIVGMVSAALTAKDWKGKIGAPINFVYGITGYIADVASYTRLLALGLAGSVIALSINLILGLLYQGIVPKELTPLSVIIAIVGLPVLAFMFIAAHSFNIFISSLGGFIHSMRLHFAEFFGKFYESGGEEFTPFKAKRKFTKVKGGELHGR